MKTKAIKSLALFVVLTIAMSVMGISTFAEGIDLNPNNVAVVSASTYTVEQFEADLEASAYAALHQFEAGEAYENTTQKAYPAVVKGIPSARKTLDLTASNPSSINISLAGTSNTTAASGTNGFFIMKDCTLTLSPVCVDNGVYKPVAIGFFTTSHKINEPAAVTVSATDNDGSIITETTANTSNDLTFFAVKAEEGKYIASLVVDVKNKHMRIDDLCILYEVAEKEMKINSNKAIVSSSATAYTMEQFEKDLECGDYAALLSFENADDAIVLDAYTAIKATELKGISDVEYGISYSKNGSVAVAPALSSASGHNLTSASGNTGLVNLKTNMEIVLNRPSAYRPVAIGFFVTSHKTGDVPSAAVTAFDNSGNAIESLEAISIGNNLTFFGFKATKGSFVNKVNVNITGKNARIDDFCVIYETTDKIANTPYISADENGYDGIYNIGDIDGVDAIFATTSNAAVSNGGSVILALFDENGKLVKVTVSDKDDKQVSIDSLASIKDESPIKTIKAFVWNMNTLVPFGACTTVD